MIMMIIIIIMIVLTESTVVYVIILMVVVTAETVIIIFMTLPIITITYPSIYCFSGTAALSRGYDSVQMWEKRELIICNGW